jgi:hypothetical protein
MTAAKHDAPVGHQRSRVLDVLFGVLFIGALAGAVIAAVTITDLRRGLAEAQRQRDEAQKQLVDFRDQLKQSESEIDKLCVAANSMNATLASPKYAGVRSELGDEVLNKSGNIASIACGITDKTR